MAYTEELLTSLQRRPRHLPATPLEPEVEDTVRYLRGASRETRRKIEGLEDDLYRREKEYDAEVSLRKSLEQRLAARLVDMYNSQPLNAELNSRLPRASHGGSVPTVRGPDSLDGPTVRGLASPGPDRPYDLLRPSSTGPDRRLDYEGFRSDPTSSAAAPGGLLLTSRVVGAPLVLSPVSLPLGSDPLGGAQAATMADSRQLSTLLSELEAVKDENRRLQTRLSDIQKDVDATKVSASGAREEVEALVAAEVADMVKEIHSAQKSRDEAMMTRLRIANDERDVALQRLHSVEAEKLGAERVSDEIKPQTVQFDTAQYPGRMNLWQPDNKDSNQLQALKEERDAAIFKYQQLQQDFNALKKSGLPNDAFLNNLDDGHAETRRAMVERDEALRRLREVEDEMQTLRVYYSLHKSLSPEMLTNQMGAIDGDQLRMQNAALQERVHALTFDIENMNQELQEARDNQEKAEAETKKLNRLVAVLRRKLNDSDRQVAL